MGVSQNNNKPTEPYRLDSLQVAFKPSGTS